jgi:hypothetical protein
MVCGLVAGPVTDVLLVLCLDRNLGVGVVQLRCSRNEHRQTVQKPNAREMNPMLRAPNKTWSDMARHPNERLKYLHS